MNPHYDVMESVIPFPNIKYTWKFHRKRQFYYFAFNGFDVVTAISAQIWLHLNVASRDGKYG